uniref:NADH-ubiquinone oxidoreductase chain 4 n=1 Tax=Karaftohelix adamsi TaxID=2013957 RepID=A0A8J9QWM0_9EUPU|nr:NADH dehydrogenase subunit 4 [Karaftohelix adamsi]
MFSWLAGMFSLLLLSNCVSSLVVLSLAIPGYMMYSYKTSTYVEDIMCCMNEMNGMLMFMTISLAVLIYLSSAYFNTSSYNLVFFLLIMAIMLCFSSSGLLGFYIFFEISLLPILVMIISWGYQPERMQAGLYMIFYTVFGSLPLFFLILWLGQTLGTSSLYLMWNMQFAKMPWLFYVGFLAFLIKLPMWSLHVWLPKAHVEAPLGGSMILAGALLKLGGYGLYIYNMIGVAPMFNISSIAWSFLAMWGGLCASLMCLNQSDVKGMIAYSSIVHMSLVVMGILSNTAWGIFCALITMVAHGWTSSALFLCAFITYEKVGSRSFNYTKGILNAYPALSLFWFLYSMVNMAVPPTINLLGELAAVPVALWFSLFMLFVLILIMFMSVTYNMYMYVKINHSFMSPVIVCSQGISARWFLTLFSHLIPLSMLFALDMMSLYTGICM